MMKDKSNNKISKKWKAYITGIITSNFTSFNKIDKYFHYPISESTVKAIQENWIRILGIDYEIICMNLCKENQPLGISLEGRNEMNRDTREVIQHHYIKSIMPTLCIGRSQKFMAKDEILEVNGIKIMGLSTKDALRTIKKLTNYFQIVVARSMRQDYYLASDYGGSEDNINSPVSFYDMDEDESSRNGTLRSVASNYSTTSRDFGSSVSFGGLIDGRYESVKEYLRNMIGWRGPIILEFFKGKESLGLALEEIPDPKSSNLIIVFKIILAEMKAGKDGRIHAGDRLLQVNGKSVSGVPFRNVCKWIKSSPGGRIVLCICKPHFESTGFDPTNSPNNDKFYYNTLRDGYKLPKLSEENDGESYEVGPLPNYMEKHITLKRIENKLGIFLDITDGGKNGARIKKLTRGIAKTDGRLKEGDFITQISEVSLRVNEKNQLEHCLKQIYNDTQDYNISYITAEDINLYKAKHATISNQRKQPIQPNVPISHIYPDPASIKLNEIPEDSNIIEKVKPPKMSFETFNITIANDFKTNLGLMLSPSLIEPDRYISITHINENSLCGQQGLLKINDDILMVNEVSFEYMSVNEGGEFLIKAIKSEQLLHFQIRRLTDCEIEVVDPLIHKLSQFHDLYLCSLKKGSIEYGFSLSELDIGYGVTVRKIDPNSPAHKVVTLKRGDRFIMINKCNVISFPKIDVMQIVKNSTKRLELLMEMPKYREFSVKIFRNSTKESLGLNIAGGCDTLVRIPTIDSLIPDRKSEFSEELFPGDLIIEVDGKRLVEQKHDEVIQILKSTGQETTFKMLRKLPYIKREILNDIELPNFPASYLQNCQYSVTINKPIDNIKSFGIHFTDVVIIDYTNDFQILDRYKVVHSIEKNSLADKYAPEIKCNDFLIAVNEVIIDCDILSEDLKNIVDNNNRINLTFSKDIPYNLQDNIKDHDSPILIKKSEHCSPSENSSVDTESIQSNTKPHNEITSIIPFEESQNSEKNTFNTQSNDNDEQLSHTDNCDIKCQSVENSTIPPSSDEIDSSKVEIPVNDDTNVSTETPTQSSHVDEQINSDENLDKDNKNKSVENSEVEIPVNDGNNVSVETPTQSSHINEEIKSGNLEEEDNKSVENSDNETEKSEVEIPVNDGNNVSVEIPTQSSHINEEIKCENLENEDNKSVENSDNETEKSKVEIPVNDGNNVSAEISTQSNHIDEQTNSDENSEEEDNKSVENSNIETENSEVEIPVNDGNNVSVEIPTQSNIDKKLEEEDNKNNCDSPNLPVESSVIKADSSEVESAELPRDKPSSSDVESNSLSDLGIDINYITVTKTPNVELGFQLYGGLEGGPNGETIPIFVVGVEKNTCNWPADSVKPLLKNGQQLIELNGQILSALKLSKIQTIIKETENELKFKIVTYK